MSHGGPPKESGARPIPKGCGCPVVAGKTVGDGPDVVRDEWCIALCGTCIYTSALHHRLRSTTLPSSVYNLSLDHAHSFSSYFHEGLCLLSYHDLDDLPLTAVACPENLCHEAKRVLLLRISRGLRRDICRTAGAAHPRYNCRTGSHLYP